MEPGSREEKNSLAMLDHLAGMGGYQLRPPSYYTVENVRLLELCFGDKERLKELPAAALQDELHAYLFIQAAPLPAVARAVRGYRAARAKMEREAAFTDFICDHVEPFLATLTPDIRAELAEQLTGFDEIEAARVDASPPPGGKTERHDPNS